MRYAQLYFFTRLQVEAHFLFPEPDGGAGAKRQTNITQKSSLV